MLPLLPHSLHPSCAALQIERLADLIEIDMLQNLTWSQAFPDILPYLPKDIPHPIIFPLTSTQFWAAPTGSDILQILHFSAEDIVVRRWSPDPDRLMTYTRSDINSTMAHTTVFPLQSATRVSLLRSSSSEGTVCCRRLQPRPVIASLPPEPKIPWILWSLDHIFAQQDYLPTFFTDGSYSEKTSVESIFRPQLTQRSAHGSIVILDSSPHWRHRPIFTIRVRDIQDIGCLSSYTPELLALTMALWIKTASHIPATIYTDSESSLDTIANRRNHLKSAKTSCHILLRRIDYLLQYCPCELLHVNSHADKLKSLTDLSYAEWGNFIADKVAGDNFADLEDLGLSLVSTDIFARNVLPDIPCTNSWYWGDAAGTPLPLVPLSSQQHDVRHQLYITDRDNYRAHLPQPLPAYWYDNSLRFVAKVYELKHASSRGLSTKVRLIMSKGWHGGNRIKSKKASAEDQVCLLCGQDDSQAHWLHHCPHPPLSHVAIRGLQRD